MKNNILRNVTLDANEKIYKDFRKLKAKRDFCQIMLTTKRLIIYTNGVSLSRGRKVKRKVMNETDLHAIHNFEYYIEYTKNRVWLRILGFLLFAAALAGAYVNYAGLYAFPVYPYSEIGNYVALGLIGIIGLLFLLRTHKTLYVKIKSGLNDISTLQLQVNKYNELAIRYLGSKIHSV
ncbi:MAG: hypothetical protein JXB20_06715 [Bacilli bacterium]|nr:hypothetical protein [Bacilli bacterium]MBN2697036.1 hypothetical protein [Bacilli bacterium]